MATDPNVSVFVHVRPDTALSVESHPEDNRVVLHIGDANCTAVFLRRADIDRFADLVADAKKSLDVKTDLRAAA